MKRENNMHDSINRENSTENIYKKSIYVKIKPKVQSQHFSDSALKKTKKSLRGDATSIVANIKQEPMENDLNNSNESDKITLFKPIVRNVESFDWFKYLKDTNSKQVPNEFFSNVTFKLYFYLDLM